MGTIAPMPRFEIYDMGDSPNGDSKEPIVTLQNVKDALVTDDHVVRSTSVKGGLLRITSVARGELMLSYYPRLMRETREGGQGRVDFTHRHSVLFDLVNIGALAGVAEGRLQHTTFDVSPKESVNVQRGQGTTVTYARVADTNGSVAENGAKCHRHAAGNSYVMTVRTKHHAARKQRPADVVADVPVAPRPENFIHGFEVRFSGHYLIMWHRFLEQALLHGIGFSTGL